MITFAVAGAIVQPGRQRGGAAAPAATEPGELDTRGLTPKVRVQLGATRDAGSLQRVQAVVGQDIVRLLMADGAELRLHPESARELFEGMAAAAPHRGEAGPAAVGGEVMVPMDLAWDGAGGSSNRGEWLDRLKVKALEIFTGPVKETALNWTAEKIADLIDGRVTPGVYAISHRTELKRLREGGGTPVTQIPKPAGGGPLLVLMHGTFVDTASTFKKLWAEWPERVASLFDRYGPTLYALEHKTVGADPFANALPLAEALPDGAALHLLTHSRGGLVAEVVARLAATEVLDEARFKALGADMALYWPSAQKLHALLRGKHVTVQRIVRVACPARGTLLASGRLDVYLSAIAWLLGKAGLPVVPELLDFLNAVAQRRTNPALLPGIQVMLPGSGLVQWLNGGALRIPGELRVVAGDLAMDSIGGFFKTLMADAYYRTDNDIVVHTASMYGGTPRDGTALYMLHRKGEATHFAYFHNDETAAAVCDGLLQAEPAQFRPIGPLSWKGESSEGYRALQRADGQVSNDPSRPAVFVLPGIMGSHLKRGDRRIWLGLGLLGGLDELAYAPGQSDGIAVDGALADYFGDLERHLERTHEVHEFAFDWRRPLEETARQLAAALDQAMDARQATGQPVRLVAHSMGGMVARVMGLEAPKTWQRLFAQRGASLLMLGVPNGGSYAPMQMLSGDDGFGNFITAVGAPFSGAKARRMIARMPGLLALQAGLVPGARDGDSAEADGAAPPLPLHLERTWRQLADDDLAFVRRRNWWNRWVFPSGDGERPGEAEYTWGVPPQAVLDQARTLRERLDRQAREDLAAVAPKIKLVVGQGQRTAERFEVDEQAGFTYVSAADGDGRVTLACALLPGVEAWRAPAGHAELSRCSAAFDAYVDLLTDGSTERLDPVLPAAGLREASGVDAFEGERFRTAQGHRSADPLDMDQPFDIPDSDANATRADRRRRPPQLVVEVVNGNLAFVDRALFIGHYVSLELTGTEWVVNERIGGTLQDALSMQAGHYPERVGMHQAFVNISADAARLGGGRPPAAVVVGLGPEGKLTERELVGTVRLAVIDWLQRQHEQSAHLTASEGAAPPIDIAAVLIGSGGVGIDPMASARSLVQAVLLANERVAERGWAPVAKLQLIELYHSRASDAWRGLQSLRGQDDAGQFQLCELIASGNGAKRRPLESNYRGANYDLVRITGRGDGVLEFSLNSRRARSEVREQSTQAQLVHQLVTEAAQAGGPNPALNRTLFHLLVPPSLEPYLAGQGNLVLDLNDSAANIPWELLEPDLTRGGADEAREPWAVRSGMIRRLQTLSEPGTGRRDSLMDDGVLVIGDPIVNRPGYGQLEGALEEAKAVVQRLRQLPQFAEPAPGRALSRNGRPEVKALLQAEAFEIITTLHARDWRIVHIAGHGDWQGAPPATGDGGDGAGSAGERAKRERGGVILSGPGIVLGPDEIQAMRSVPELVFINCCHLAKAGDGGPDSTAMARLDYGEFAAGVARTLIRIGVRCVIAAGWAVDDRAAQVFANTFYDGLMAGKDFAESVTQARRKTYRFERNGAAGNTWAAYQCYGDPQWRLKLTGGGGASRSGAAKRFKIDPAAMARRYGHIASAPTLVVALESLAVDAKWTSATQERSRHEARWLDRQFGRAMGHIGAVAEAFGLVFEYCGDFAQAIPFYAQALQASDGSASLKANERLGNLLSRSAWEAIRTPTELVNAQGQTETPLARAERALLMLQSNAQARSTPESQAILGSAYKRLAMIRQHTKASPAEVQAALDGMKAAYSASLDLAEVSPGDRQYPLQNLLALQMRIQLGSAQPLDAAGLAAIDDQCQRLEALFAQERLQRPSDEWLELGEIEVQLIRALCTPGNAAQRDLAVHAAIDALNALKRRIPSPATWRSMLDQWEFILPPALTAGQAPPAAIGRLMGLLTTFAELTG